MIRSLLYRDSRLESSHIDPSALDALLVLPGTMLWLDVEAPTEDEMRLVFEETLQLHPLTLEDCRQGAALPKLEDYGEYLHLVMHYVTEDAEGHIHLEPVDLLLGRNFLVTHHRVPVPSVQAAYDKYARAASTIVRGPDRLMHQVLDFMAEAVKPLLALRQHELEEYVGAALRNIPGSELFPRTVLLRKHLGSLRSALRPQRETAAQLAQFKTKLIRPLLVPYLRDLAEEYVRMDTQSALWTEELILSFRVYLNKSSYEAGQGVKVLTGITALTIPVLTMGAWFGMNFKRMPELSLWWAYPLAGLLMFSGTFGMLWVMRKRRWL